MVVILENHENSVVCVFFRPELCLWKTLSILSGSVGYTEYLHLMQHSREVVHADI